MTDWAKIIRCAVVNDGDDELLDHLLNRVRMEALEEAGYAVEEVEEDEVEEPVAAPVKRVSKRAAAKATTDGKTHLSDEQVTQLRRRRFKDGATYTQLAAEFQCSESSVANLIKRQTRGGLPFVEGEPGFVEEAAAREERIQARRDRAADGLDSHSFGGRKLPEAGAA